MPKTDPTLSFAKQGVSIIICAKNEATNLKENIPEIMEQKYTGGFEVIVVNDASNDDTGNVLRELKQRFPELKEVIISSFETRKFKGKKHALSKGVVAAQYDWLLLTDADCKPASENWLQSMVAPLSQGKEIVAGYGGYYKQRGLLNAFTRWETMHSFLQYSTYAVSGKPYMAVGRNMACAKKTFLQAQQSEIWNELPSGDDDLLVSICGKSDNVAMVCNEDSFTYSAAKTSWTDWVKQKQRHLSTGKYYKMSARLLLGTYAFAHAAMWLCLVYLLFTVCRLPATLIVLARCLIYWLTWMVSAYKLKERSLVYFFPLFDIGWMIYNFVFFPYIIWKNKQHWK